VRGFYVGHFPGLHMHRIVQIEKVASELGSKSLTESVGVRIGVGLGVILRFILGARLYESPKDSLGKCFVLFFIGTHLMKL
jgi:hypothetical protein